MEGEYNSKSLAEKTEQSSGNQPVQLTPAYKPPLFKSDILERIQPKFRDFAKLSPEQLTIQPKFRDPSTLSFEQLTDPDYRLKQLEELNQGRFSITCSRCHHCR